MIVAPAALTVFVYYYWYHWIFNGGKVGQYAAVYLLIIYCWGGSDGYYFVLLDDRIVVKNDFFFWTKREVRLADIRDVFLESGLHHGTALKILTKENKILKYAVPATKESKDGIKEYLGKHKIPFSTDMWYI